MSRANLAANSLNRVPKIDGYYCIDKYENRIIRRIPFQLTNNSSNFAIFSSFSAFSLSLPLELFRPKNHQMLDALIAGEAKIKSGKHMEMHI